MKGDRIKFKSGFKYQLSEDYLVKTSITGNKFASDFFNMTADGQLAIFRGYAWDGPSGPTVDTDNFMRGSLVHDALYQAIREGHLPRSCRDDADRELQKICLEDGMSAARAYWVYVGVRFGGGPAANGDGGKPLCEAP